MSTRGIIARAHGASFTGRYHHSDSYPSGLGKALFDAYNGHFKQDGEAMMHFLIDEHPAGWSSVVDVDFTLAPGFSSPHIESYENFDEEYEAYNQSENGRRPHCYCHGERYEKAQEINSFSGARDAWAMFVYVVDVDSHIMTISAKDGDKWREVASVDLFGEEPDWNMR